MMTTWSTVRRVMRHVPVLLRGRPLHGSERYRPFFIVGSGRCGSTLLRAMLEAHPNVHVPPESGLAPAVRDFRRFSRLPWNVVLRLVLAQFEYHGVWEAWDLPLRPLYHELNALPRTSRNLATVVDRIYRAHITKHKPGATRWGDKTPSATPALPALHAVFPDLQVVHLLRDGRDVVQSFMRVSQARLPHFAAMWLRSVRAARAFGAQHPRQYLEIRYEDLVRRPAEILASVATFLDLPFDERMLRHHTLDLRLGDVDRYPALQGAREPVYETSIGRWRGAFASTELAELDRLIGPALAALGYRDGP
jgi:hypothetical protein